MDQEFFHLILQQEVRPDIELEGIQSVGGGDICDSFSLLTSQGKYFLKLHDIDGMEEMFRHEANGLEALHYAGFRNTPEVISFGKKGPKEYLLLEWIERGTPASNFWEFFGIKLAEMHAATNSQFGYFNNNLIGPLLQINNWNNSWTDFLFENRLFPLVDLAIQSKRMEEKLKDHFEQLFLKAGELFPEEKPALLHGDLWSGNYMVGADGYAWIFDPAVYYGFREMDLAMSRLFGGFHPRFYEAYHQQFPLQPGWEERVDLCNLYPLLVHTNLFGGHYAHRVKEIVREYI